MSKIGVWNIGGPFWCWRFCLFQKKREWRLESRTFMRWRSSASRDYDISQASHGSQTGRGKSWNHPVDGFISAAFKKEVSRFPSYVYQFHMYSMNSWTLLNHAANIKQLYDIQNMIYIYIKYIYIYMIIYGRQIVFSLGWSPHPGFSLCRLHQEIEILLSLTLGFRRAWKVGKFECS